MLNREALFAAVAASLAEEGCTGVLFVRAQRLRDLELTFGYEAGERLADAMERRLLEALRPVDRAFRVGGCDFAVVLPRLRQRQHAALAAGKIARSLREPHVIDACALHANIAVGVATSPEDGDDASTLCRRADAAVTTAVHMRERHAFNPSEPHRPVAYADLHEAIAGNRLETWLQPICAVDDGRLLGVESLTRWRHRNAWVPPAQFVAAAEKTGLIEALTHWSIHGTLRQCAPTLRLNRGLACSVNLSPRAVLDYGIVEQVDAALRLWDVPPNALKLEITETAFIDDVAVLSDALNELRAMGVGISIDDYGTGYSSLAYLRDFPVDEIKIDRSFVADMVVNPRSARIAATVVDLAHGLGMHTVAEGVENEEVLSMLKNMGCDRYQGYLHGRPRPASEVLSRIETGVAVQART